LAARGTPASLYVITSLMEDYAKRGVFRGFNKLPIRRGVAAFQMIWHWDRRFEVIARPRTKTITIPVLLSAVPARSSLYRDFKAFVKSSQAESLAPHRRIDKRKVRVGDVSLSMVVRDSDYGYALQRLIHLVHETYLIFLPCGPYHEYMVEELGAPSEIG
jgi:hypothetical protein